MTDAGEPVFPDNGEQPIDDVPKERNISDIMKSSSAISLTIAMQPLIVTRTLMQVGYEPLDPVAGLSFVFRKPGYYYPNLFSYMNHIRKLKGWSSLWKGLTPKLANLLVSEATEKSMEALIREKLPYRGSDGLQAVSRRSTAGVLYEIMVMGVSKTVSVIVTQPLHVVMVRTIASLVSDDEAYSGVWSTIRETYKSDGVLGFFSGLLPRWITEILTISVGYSLMCIAHRLLEYVKADDIESNSSSMGTVVQFAVSSMTYRFTLVSTIKAAATPGLHLGFPPYGSWSDVYCHLSDTKSLSRGSSFFMRKAVL